eukprot:gnl/TRDRNA2_/TRDRNA2_36578_c0_seq1.p1 gnl/TRDRNA2_/TRDRNA2_36578_c0~~gnl/TRDRNA2_/TRDRNA2_36578_c0_seq1.p1  ORF type:complete len:206 (+),score=19.18 gnl/TRDRNA2_/TRDRNA2_36578_c0_seq1:85-618(+)
MCFPHKDHRLNMLHSAALVTLLAGLFAGLMGQYPAFGAVIFAVVALVCTNKTWFMCLCICYGFSALAGLFFVGLQSAVMFVPEADFRGVMKDQNYTDSLLEIEGPDAPEIMKFVGYFALIAGCMNSFCQLGLAYYSWEVYHYNGHIEDLLHGPGMDGRGHVAGVHEPEHAPMVSHHY